VRKLEQVNNPFAAYMTLAIVGTTLATVCTLFVG
jgi:hypothetical protein